MCPITMFLRHNLGAKNKIFPEDNAMINGTNAGTTKIGITKIIMVIRIIFGITEILIISRITNHLIGMVLTTIPIIGKGITTIPILGKLEIFQKGDQVIFERMMITVLTIRLLLGNPIMVSIHKTHKIVSTPHLAML